MNNSLSIPDYIRRSEEIRTAVRSLLYLPTYKPGDVNIAQSLLSNSEFYYYAAQNVNALVRTWQVATDVNKQIRDVWNDLFMALEQKKELFVGTAILELKDIFLKLYPPVTQEFSDTDLIVYPDNWPHPLPACGVRSSEFQSIRKLYQDIFQVLKIEGTFAFREFIKKNIRVLLTRKEGRELFAEFFRGKVQIKIQIAEETWSILPDTIQFCPDKIMPCFYLANGKKTLVYPLDFSELFHEFIHIFHSHTNRIAQIQNIRNKANDTHHFQNREEEITILGPGFNENQILTSFGLFPRIQYEVPLCFSDNYSEWRNLFNLAKLNQTDQYTRLQKIIPASRVRKIIRMLKSDSVPLSSIESLEKLLESGYYFELSNLAKVILNHIFQGNDPFQLKDLLKEVSYQELRGLKDNLIDDLLEPSDFDISRPDAMLEDNDKQVNSAIEILEEEFENRVITKRDKDVITPENPFDFIPPASFFLSSHHSSFFCPSLPLSSPSLPSPSNQCYALSTNEIFFPPPLFFRP